jgi:hypothetical protein
MPAYRLISNLASAPARFLLPCSRQTLKSRVKCVLDVSAVAKAREELSSFALIFVIDCQKGHDQAKRY